MINICLWRTLNISNVSIAQSIYTPDLIHLIMVYHGSYVMVMVMMMLLMMMMMILFYQKEHITTKNGGSRGQTDVLCYVTIVMHVTFRRVVVNVIHILSPPPRIDGETCRNLRNCSRALLPCFTENFPANQSIFSSAM